MKLSRPYIIETENFVEAYYGGGCNPGRLRISKRNEIHKFSRASQKRLLRKIDSAVQYNPNLIIKFYFQNEVSLLDSGDYLTRLFKSLDSFFCYTVRQFPLVFWRKCFREGEFYFSCLLDIPEKTNWKCVYYIIQMFWKLKTGQKSRVEFIRFNSDEKLTKIKEFVFNDSLNCKNEKPGRFWGTFYSKHHNFKDIKKKYYSAHEIKNKCKDLKVITEGEIRRFYFEKEKKEEKN